VLSFGWTLLFSCFFHSPLDGCFFQLGLPRFHLGVISLKLQNGIHCFLVASANKVYGAQNKMIGNHGLDSME
jgi:hypothetical protein